MEQKLSSKLRKDLDEDLRDVWQCLLKSIDPSVALERLHSKLSNLAPSEVTRFELVVRGHIAAQAGHELFERSAGIDITRLATYPRLALIWLFHSNGYCREAALRLWPDEPLSPFFLTALFWRTNDGVSQVRSVAEKIVASLLPHISADVACETVLFLYRRMKYWPKMSQVVVCHAGSLLARKDVQIEIVRHFTGGANASRTAELNACLRFDFLDSHLPELAQHSKSPAIRRLALRVLQNGYAEIPVDVHTVITDKIYGKYKLVRNMEHRPIAKYKYLPSLIRSALADKSVFVRRMAADGLILHRKSFRDVDLLAKTLLGDRKASIRERGDFLLRTTSNNKPRKQP